MPRIVCLSDTHGSHRDIEIPDGDVLIHAGDFCNYGTLGEVAEFAGWFERQPHPHKAVVAGNHDWPLEVSRAMAEEVLLGYSDNIHYLQDSGVEVLGLSVYGTPWQPAFNGWAFNLPRHGVELRRKMEQIPKGLDILVTHSAPYGTLDYPPPDREKSLGCERLAEALVTRRPRLHVFGHIHSGYGREEHSYGVSVNASLCDQDYRRGGLPWVVDL